MSAKIVIVGALSTFLCLIGFFSMNQLAYAQDSTQLESICVSGTPQYDSPICEEVRKNTSNETTGVDKTLRTVANILAYVGGFIAVVIMVLSGIRLIMSDGDSSKIAIARNSIIYAAIGIVVIIFARALVLFVINAVG